MMVSVSLFLTLWLSWNSMACVRAGRFEGPPSLSVLALAETETRLPCPFQVEGDEQVVQVIWTREKTDGTKEQIITAHHTDGQTEFAGFTGRVRFEASNPTVNSALIILSTEVADEAKYICHIATFPSGSFETQLSLIVWTKPISSLDPVVLEEGQTFRPAASCRSVARPPPSLSWDTDLTGVALNRSTTDGVASTQFSLHPLRGMNGHKLDCLVWHPSQKQPLRLRNQLVVHYPPDAVISGYDQMWHVGLEGAGLRCEGGGNPKPQNFTWIREDDSIPEGVSMSNGLLQFDRPLLLTDAGNYKCVTTNLVGSGTASIEISVTESPQKQTSLENLLMIIVGAAAGLLVLILLIVVIAMNRHHKRKHKQLAIELDEKKEEISTLSRQASFRRVNSVSTDHKYQDETLPLRVEGTIRTSLSSLERPRSRDSRSTLGGGAVDALGRPAIYNTSRRGRERPIERDGEKEATRMRVESFVRNSNMSLLREENLLHPPLHLVPYPVEQTAEIVRPVNGNALLNGSAILPAERPRSGGSSHHQPLSLSSSYPPATDEEDEEDELSPTDEEERVDVLRGLTEPDGGDMHDSDPGSLQMSEVLLGHFEKRNGTLPLKVRAIALELPPNSPFIHKAQIV